MGIDIEQTKVGLRTFIVSLVAVAGVAISGTITYSSLVYANEKIDSNTALLIEKIDYTNNRMDRITARLEEDIHELEHRIDQVELESQDPE